MKKSRLTGVTLAIIWICLVSANLTMAQAGPSLQPFTAKYQLNRGRMLIGKVTNTLRLEDDGSYTYTSITKPIGIAAVFSKDVITEISQGNIINNLVAPTTYTYEHKRKKRPKFRKQQFDWSSNKLSVLAPKPVQTIEISKGTQDKASMVLAMMQAMTPDTISIKINVADKKKLKEYLMSAQGQEQIQNGGASYNSIKLTASKSGQTPDTAFWLAPKLNYLPVQIEKKEKKDTYTMVLVEYTQGQPKPTKK